VIIDCHTHVGRHLTDDIDPADPGDLAVDYGRRTSIMDENGIDRAVFMPTYTYDRRDGIAGTRRLNDRLREIEREHDRLVRGIGTVEPLHGSAALDELGRLADAGFVGVSWHHKYQGGPIDEPVTRACLRRLDDLDMVGVIHAYQIADAENLEYLDAVADETDRPLVILDALSTALGTKRAIELGRRHDNLHFDTAMLHPLGNPIDRIVDELGADRLLFGTAQYTRPLQYRRSATLFQVQHADVPEKARERILAGNARRLFDID